MYYNVIIGIYKVNIKGFVYVKNIEFCLWILVVYLYDNGIFYTFYGISNIG